ncbi:rod shape-determining protein MreC [Halieaceae bacterium IMCC14734]|uniref:Cell shape-determining protein MreC n=1 Tax=Candidatus Litorirhabdus singularis TaxID=2518993 RepID=A0ABT3TJH0_9GAMM|nr:rod shape-determining protein MreC [Candidatus Litorirhabdus singularis]
MFVQETSAFTRVALTGVLALTLIFADVRFNQMAATRATLSNAAYPFYWLVDLPARLSSWSSQILVTRSTLLEENAHLRSESQLLQGKMLQMAALRAENLRLRALLNSSALVQDDVLVAELIGVTPDPARHQVVLNKGTDDGVFVGQPLLDADGLMGQVIEAGNASSRVLLITDATHALPVQVNRNGVRAIAEGVGRLDVVELRHVASTTDIEVGDLLVTSGLGRRFPVGYPVATVIEVTRDPGQPFAVVKARPNAALNRSRHVLLVFKQSVAD